MEFIACFPSGSDSKESSCSARDPGLIPGSGRSLGGERSNPLQQPTPVFLCGESHGQRSLVGYSPWGRKEWDTTEQLTHTQNSVTSVPYRGGRLHLKQVLLFPYMVLESWPLIAESLLLWALDPQLSALSVTAMLLVNKHPT